MIAPAATSKPTAAGFDFTQIIEVRDDLHLGYAAAVHPIVFGGRATPARGDLLELDPPTADPIPVSQRPATDALQWVRGE